MMTDPIADMLTRIRNAQAVKKHEVLIPASRMKRVIADILHANGYIGEVREVTPEGRGRKGAAQFSVALKYEMDGQPKIHAIRRLSTPGRRLYVGKEHIPTVLNNLGIAILSTSQGLMTNRDAKKQGCGGEVICEIW
ncbi:30S ribosomal protein S8 [Candidatus Uhrbacteria bacterium]|nr:30S ribosomal protein S8 [Candidatus Uhrbacteria bacterium]